MSRDELHSALRARNLDDEFVLLVIPHRPAYNEPELHLL